MGNKESILNKWCWSNWLSAYRRMQIDPYLSPCTRLKFKWIKDLNIKQDTLNLIEEKMGKSCDYIGTGDDFLSNHYFKLEQSMMTHDCNLFT